MHTAAIVATIPLLFFAAMLPAAPTNNPQGPALEAGAPPKTRFPINENWRYGGRVEMQWVNESNYDLDPSSGDELTTFTPLDLSLALSWHDRSRWSAYANFELIDKQIISDERGGESSDTELQIDKLHADLHGDGFHLRIGRQRFKDKREWMFDDTLDGLRLTLERPTFLLTGAILRERAFTENLLRRDDSKRVDHYWLRFTPRTTKPEEHAIFALLQRDRERNETARWLGLYSGGKWGDLRYWAELATVQGERRGRGISGFGIDVGATLRLMKHPRVYAVAGFAFGSGDDNDADLGFRQTGLQDNAAKFGGVARTVYYGEVLDPELGNLAIATAGIVVRPVRRASVTLLWHAYRQQYPLDELRDSDLGVEPNGDSRDIGTEIDLVFGWRATPRLKFTAVVGRFIAGRAFDGDADATLLELEIRYNL